MVIIVGVAIEAFTLDLTFIWFAVGALAALIVLMLGGGLLAQLVAFAVAAAILLALVRPMTRRLLRPKGARTNADRIVGETVLVTEEIDNVRSTGAVKVLGQEWSARSVDGSVIQAGETVRICAISGVKAMVERVRKED
ncbi:MAG: NfeD family protein [Butyricicoccus sp.]